MCEHVASVDFSSTDSECVDHATERFTEVLLSVCDIFVSRRTLVKRSSSHPWLSERCRLAVASKKRAFGLEFYVAEYLVCNFVLKDKFYFYMTTVNKNLFRLRSAPKQFRRSCCLVLTVLSQYRF